MPRSDYKRCRLCDKPSVEVGSLSHTRLCAGCAQRELSANVLGIAAQAGPEYQRWRRGMVAWVVDAILDDAPSLVQGGSDAT